MYQGNGSGPLNIGSPPVPGSSVLEVLDSGYGNVGSFGSSAYVYGGKVTDNVNCGGNGQCNIAPNESIAGSIQNSSPGWTVYQLLDNGNATGDFVAVPAGGTGSINYIGPAGDNYTFQQEQNGTVTVNSSNGGSYTQNPNGSINFVNGQFTPNPGSGGNGSYTVGESGNNLTISNINWSTNTTGTATKRQRFGLVLRPQTDLFPGGGVLAVKNTRSPKQDESRFHNWISLIEKPVRFHPRLGTRVLASFSEFWQVVANS